MKVQISVVGSHPRPDITWPEGWPVPRLGEIVSADSEEYSVRTIVWYPHGDPETPEDPEPFVYVVIGPQRPHMIGGQ